MAIPKLDVERHGLLLILRTERGKGFISKVARFRLLWKVLGSIGIAVGILGMIFVVLFLLDSVYLTLILKVPTQGAKPVIPGVTIPFWYGIVGLVSVLVVHEFSHGILAKSEDVPIKNIGAVFIGIIPIGAFVEPEEDVLKEKGTISRMRIYAAGSFGNILVAILAIVPILLIPGYFFDLSVVEIGGVVEGSPSENVLEESMVLRGINGMSVSRPEDFFDAMSDVRPGDVVTLETDRGPFDIVAVKRDESPKGGLVSGLVNIVRTLTGAERQEKPERGFIGTWVTYPLNEGVSLIIISSLYWIALLNQGIGLINLAPLHLGIATTDGHSILKDIMEKLRFKNAEKITASISMTMVVVLVLTLIGPSLVKGGM